MKKSDKIIATISMPLVEALLAGNYSFKAYEDAVDKLSLYKRRFIESRYHETFEDPARAMIWIKGYSITPAEKEEGAVGNYALIFIQKTADSLFTLSAIKVEAPVKLHPERKRIKQKMPDWGFYVLRNIRKGNTYSKISAAQADLNKIAEEYPEVSIPCTGKLYTIIYTKQERAKRYVFEIEALETGEFIIKYKANDQKKPKKPAIKTTTEEHGENAPGKFTAMVELKRHKRKKA